MENDKASQVRQSRKPETAVVSLRLTKDEKQHLQERAGSMPLGAFVRSLILSPQVKQERRRVRNPVKNDTALARILATLGQSRLSSNFNQLAKALHIGALPVTPETEQEILDACTLIRAIRSDLVQALGLEERL